MGGLAAQRDVSLQTGEAVYHALTERGYKAVRVFVDRDLDLMLRQQRVDVAFMALHGRCGEDGVVQGVLELMGIPYTGSGVCASAMAMNKLKAKEVFRLHNLPTPAYYSVSRSQGAPVLDEELAQSFGFPCVVKPAREGSSIGVRVARDLSELETGLEDAYRFDDEILVERFIAGREVSVAILGDQPIGAIEIVSKGGIFDYGAKQTAGRAEYHFPARLSGERYRGVLRQAVAAHRALGCEGLSRVDLIVSDLGNEYVLEVNSLPPLGAGALYPKMAHASGIEFGELCERILLSASLKVRNVGGERRVVQTPFRGPERRAAGSPEPN
jgi:D-alanine-D-alanine ligase